MANTIHQYRPSALSQVSHELRIPLTGILGMAHFLEETPLTAEQKKYLKGILDSANRLLGLENKIISIFKTLKEEDICH
jgi:signal transduction histidine kinase